MKSTFIIIRSILLVFTVYIAFILNNSFAQYFTSQVLVTGFLLTFILADLFSFGYKILFSNPPGSKLFIFFLVLAPGLIFDFPILINNFIIITSILLYIYCISFLANFFSIEDQMGDYNFDTVHTNKYISIHERKGLLYSTYILIYNHPLLFLSTDDAQHFIDFLRTSQGSTSLSFSSNCSFMLSAKGLRFSSHTRDILFQTACDLEKIALNLLIK